MVGHRKNTGMKNAAKCITDIQKYTELQVDYIEIL